MDERQTGSSTEESTATGAGSACANEPIAIIGIGCRFPGEANDPSSFWRILRDGVDAVAEIPPDRWSTRKYYSPEPGIPGKTNTRWGGFVENIDSFDARFFGISPREAAWMDPQQRLLLEVAWESLEDAGQPAKRLEGTGVGVFIGISLNDYALLQTSLKQASTDIYANTGSAFSIAANRISYCFDFQGPSVAVDTACSSSLVAVHIACQSMWSGECPLALAGGVNCLLSPIAYVGFSKMGMMSPDGRCKAFDAGANGFVRSEGAGLVVLKPLSRALADGDRIYALIRATTSNQDGRTSGMTVPSQSSQETLVREACRQAGVHPAQLQFIEAHGTGTLVGDPIEARALGAVLVDGREQDDCCLLGSVKTNVGHLESASGIAGLVKTALALRHRMIPPNLHFREPNPDIAFDALKLRVPRTLQPWPEGAGPALAGVNSFGFGGANAHVILEEAPGQDELPSSETDGEPNSDPLQLVPLSARSPEALRAMAGTYASFVQADGGGAEVSLRDLVFNAGLRRSHLDHRLVAVVRSREELAEQLRCFSRGEAAPAVVCNQASVDERPRVVFVFSGQGPQWWGMGRQLLAAEPVFREMIHRCDALVRDLGDWSLLKELAAEESRSRMQETAIAQPAIFALQAALVALWRSYGVRPDAVVGHSVGEVAAAYAAEILSLQDAVRTIFHRGRCMELAHAQGRMLAAGLSVQEGEQFLKGRDGLIGIAAVNSPSSLTFSGEAQPIEALARTLEQREVFCRLLPVKYAFHSALMDPMQTELLQSLQGLRPQTASVPFYSTVLARRVEGRELDAEYWWQNVRRPVRFAEAVDGAIEGGCAVALELAPHPVLASAVAECFMHRGQKATVLASLRRKQEERPTLLRSLGALHTLGYPLPWTRLAPRSGRFVRLPSYPWQREHAWHESEASKVARLGSQGHPLLGSRLPGPHPTWENTLDPAQVPFLDDHRVQGYMVLPGTAYVEMALAAAQEISGEGPYVLEDIRLVKACFLTNEQTPTVRTIVDPAESTFSIHGQAPEAADQAWTTHARGVLPARRELSPAPGPSLDELRSRFTREISHDDCYAFHEQMGFLFGPSFKGIDRLWLGEGESLGRIEIPESLTAEVGAYLFHPAILDACFQVSLGAVLSLKALRNLSGEPPLYLPAEYGQIRVYGSVGGSLFSHVHLAEATRRHLLADVRIFDEAGAIVAEVRGLGFQAISVAEGAADTLDELLFEYRWQFQPRPDSRHRRRDASFVRAPGQIVASGQTRAEQLMAKLARREKRRELEAGVNGLCTAYVLEALEQLGANFRSRPRFSYDSLADELGVAAQHRRQFGRILEMLEEDGVLRRDGSAWELRRWPAPEDSSETWKRLLARHPDFFGELSLLGRCGRRLAPILRGDENPLELIFPHGSLALVEQFYTDSPTVLFYNTLARHAVGKLLEDLPQDRTLRVLEIGAGTGGLTSFLLPRLPADRTEYVFTDVSNHFLNKAQQRFSDHSFVQYQVLDIEQDPAEQGFGKHSFDLILASLVLHATVDLRQTLEHVKRLLGSRGALVLIEPVQPVRWVDMVFGLTEGWWRFADTDLRPSYPMLSFSRWKTVLEQLGFTDTTDYSRTERPASGFNNAVILARGPSVEPAPDPAAASPTESAHSGNCLIFADRGGLGEQVAEQLRSCGERATLIFAGEGYVCEGPHRFQVSPGSREEMQQLLQVVLGDRPGDRTVVYLWALDAPLGDEPAADFLDSAQTLACSSVVHLVQAWSAVAGSEPARFWLVTRGVHSTRTTDELAGVAQSPLWGMGRVIINEFPHLHCRMVDLSARASAWEFRSLLEELQSPDEEDEIALRGDARYVHRYCPTSLETYARRDSGSEDRSFRLEISRFGVLDGLTLRATPRRSPGPGMVEIQIVATALNFSDIMKALGLYPGLTDDAVPVGLECAGRISAVGEGVEGWQVGDEVLAVAPFSLASHVVTRTDLVARKPQALSFEEGATIPVAFLTASYALHHAGKIQKGDRILIHSATGGVGLAAVQLAARAGAEIFATAGTPEKREFLESIGVRHVMDSRSVAFADEVLERTGGAGVDIVLNSLAGEAIGKGLATLGENGRFLEIGKRDIYQNTRVGLRPFRKNVSFIAIDLDRAMRTTPDLLAALFRKTMQDLGVGTLTPLPHRVFSMASVVDAFRHMAQAKHIGKVVVSVEDAQVSVAPEARGAWKLRADATYLITGGLGGFGLRVAQWMVEQGARHLALVGRRGVHSPEVADDVEALRKAGASVTVAKADVARPEQLAAVFTDVAGSMPPLRGIVHAAMVLEDCLLLNLDRECLRRVIAPKMDGAWNLHRQTLAMPLDFFVLFSSLASVFGGPGQANYSAANLFLDSLAHYRRARGLPALAINWGYLGDVGVVARKKKISEHLESKGFKSFSPREALTLLGRLLSHGTTQVSVMRADLTRVRDVLPSFSVSPRFSLLVKEAASAADGQTGDGLAIRRAVLAAAPEERREVVLSFVREKVARVLGADVATVEVDKPLAELGFDSLMGFEMRNWAEGELRVSLPVVELMRGPSVARLSDLLLEKLTEGEACPARDSNKIEEIVEKLEQLSEEEAQEALADDRASI